jgi:FkbM family methyltransferase
VRTLTDMLAALYLTTRRLGIRGVPRICGRGLYLVMRWRHRRFRALDDRRVSPDVPADADTVRIAGLVWSVPRDDRKPGSLSDRLLHRELPLAEILRTRRFGRGGVMIDIGANIGTTSIPRLLLGDVNRVYGVEPDPTNYACLQRTIADNGLAAHVQVDRVALGSVDGEADLLVASRLGRHRLLAAGVAKRNTIRVSTMRVDTWAARLGADLNRVRYVKCDTQGWEAHVLAGAPRLLARSDIIWEMEICPGLLDAAGSSLDDLVATIARQFDWFVDLRSDDETLDRRASADLANAVRAAVGRKQNYTNVILGH